MLRLGGTVVLLLVAATSAAHAQDAPDTDSVKTNVMLCDSPEHAVAFTVAVNDGDSDDMAKDVVGRAAGAEVCDKFIGHASIEQQKTIEDKGRAYTVFAYKFKGVGAMKWSAIPQDKE